MRRCLSPEISIRAEREVSVGDDETEGEVTAGGERDSLSDRMRVLLPSNDSQEEEEDEASARPD